jgi:alkylhydroperoxidase family enzyme
MARVPYLDDTIAPELKPLADRIRAQRGGRLLNLYRALLNSPGVAQAWLQFFSVIRQQCDLPARDRELVILVIALINDAEYEYRQHIPFALQAGLTQAQLDELPRWRDSAAFDQRDRAVLSLAECMTRDVHVPDEVFAAVERHFAPAQLVELTATIAGYNMVSRVLEALRIDHE